MKEQVILVTGASAGIGLSCATHLAERGHRVYGASRNIDKLSDAPFERLVLDVDDSTSVDAAFATVIVREHRIDAIVNAAGFGIAGPIEATTVAEAKRQFETNFFGIHRVCRAALPIMRKQGCGAIINVSSLGGLTAIPFQAFYTATKFAVEGYTEGLRMEVAPFGIRVYLVEPGDFKTEFTARRERVGEPEDITPYEPAFTKALTTMERDEQRGADPIAVAERIAKLIENPVRRFRHPVGAFAQRIAVQLKQILPYSLYESMIKSYYRLAR